MTAEKMQMVRRDVKPGNGTSLLTYQNHANLKKHLAEMRPMVDARAGDHYLRAHAEAPERYAHVRHRQMEEMRKENNRLFGRLLSIYEVSSFLPKSIQFVMLLCRKNLLLSEIINQDRSL